MGNVRGAGDKLLAGHESVSDDIAFYNGSSFYLKRPITWAPGCGNDVVEPGEAFDTGQPGAVSEYAYTCGAFCGDGVLQNGEFCDDGNDSNADQCSTNCQAHRCGDGLVRQDLQPGDDGYEYCDDGNREWDDACASDCNRCGDGVVGRFEGCDDGNDIVDDGCFNCVLDSCGNGQVDEGEDCDDGNVHSPFCPNCVRVSVLSNGQTTQSSSVRVPGDGPANAVDGNFGNYFHSAEGTNQWWQVDLQSSHYITGIKLWSRDDCCPEQAQNFDVQTSIDGQTWGPAMHVAEPVARPSSFALHITGRYVRLRNRGGDSRYLTLAEVQILGF
jgi:cysteine-rich repeat protein